MSTLNELKDWIEQGEKICRESSRDLVYSLNEEDELRDKDDGVATYQSLIASDWVKVEEDTRWKSTGEEHYYFINDEFDSGIGKHVWFNDDIDNNLYKSYNCFKTREEAKQTRALWLAERELRSLADGGLYCIYYEIRTESFIAIHSVFNSGPYHFSTREKADAAIKKLGKDKLKLIYGVK